MLNIPSQLTRQTQTLPLVVGWDRTHAEQAQTVSQRVKEQRQVRRRSRATLMASRCASEHGRRRGGDHLKQKARLAGGSRYASFVEEAQKATDQAMREAGAAHASAGVGMASCTWVYEPVVAQLDIMADLSKVRRECHVHPRRHQVEVWVLTREHTCTLRYMKAWMWVRVA